MRESCGSSWRYSLLLAPSKGANSAVASAVREGRLEARGTSGAGGVRTPRTEVRRQMVFLRSGDDEGNHRAAHGPSGRSGSRHRLRDGGAALSAFGLLPAGAVAWN